MNQEMLDLYTELQKQISNIQKFKSHLPSSENRIKHEGIIRGLELALEKIIESDIEK